MQEISSLDRVFRPGMLVRCVVLKLDITKGGALSIKLSINPKLLNKALRPGTLRPGMVSRRAGSPGTLPHPTPNLAYPTPYLAYRTPYLAYPTPYLACHTWPTLRHT